MKPVTLVRDRFSGVCGSCYKLATTTPKTMLRDMSVNISHLDEASLPCQSCGKNVRVIREKR